MYKTPAINIAKHINDISTERLNSYRRVYPHKSEDEIYGMYCWNSELSSRISMAIGIYEVCLRNKIHRVMSNYIFNNKNTYNGNLSGDKNSCNWYDKIATTGKVKWQIDEIYNEGGFPPPHKIISSISHGSWRYILEINKTNNGKNIPWDVLFPLIFSSTPDNFFNKSSRLNELKLNMKRINILRNRVSHFEPIWKNKILKSIDGKKQIKPEPTTIADCISRMRSEYNTIISTLSYISIEMHQFYIGTMNHIDILSMMTEGSLKSFMSQSETIALDVEADDFSQKVIEQLSNPLCKNWLFELKKSGNVIGHIRKS
ncbi:hypothetical protein ABIE02_004455 [Leclercia sp. 1548]